MGIIIIIVVICLCVYCYRIKKVRTIQGSSIAPTDKETQRTKRKEDEEENPGEALHSETVINVTNNDEVTQVASRDIASRESVERKTQINT